MLTKYHGWKRSKGARNGFSRGRGSRSAAKVGSAERFIDQCSFDGPHDTRGSLGFAEKIEHPRCGPDLGDGVGDAFAGDVGRRAMNGLEERRIAALGIDVA